MIESDYKPIKEMTTEELREYKRRKAQQYNDKPKIKCEVCDKEIKPCSKKSHDKSMHHRLALTILKKDDDINYYMNECELNEIKNRLKNSW